MAKSKWKQSGSHSRCVRVKTQKTAAKRVRRTATGKLRIRHAFKGHLLTRKSARRKRALRQPALVSAADSKAFQRLVPPN